MREIARRLVNNVWRTIDVDEAGNGGSQTMRSASVDLTNGECLALFDSPVTIVPEPVDGTQVIPLWVTETLHQGVTPFSNNGVATKLEWGGQTVPLGGISSALTTDNAGVTHLASALDGTYGEGDFTAVVYTADKNWAGGDGTITVTVYYCLVDFA